MVDSVRSGTYAYLTYYSIGVLWGGATMRARARARVPECVPVRACALDVPLTHAVAVWHCGL